MSGLLRKGALPFGALLFFSGCVATQQDVIDLSQQSDEVKAQVAELKKSIATMQGNQADFAVKMDQLHADLSAFTETLRDSQSAMSKLSVKLDDLEAALGQKVTALGETITKQQAEAAKKAAEAAASPGPSQIFHSAQIQLGKKNFKTAIQGFETYLKKYPKGEVADLATFNLGEAYFGDKQWEDAATQYALVLDKHPKSSITPSARLKYAMSLIQMKQNIAEAKRYLESIPDDFPKSSEAAAAAKLLNQLNAPKQKAQ